MDERIMQFRVGVMVLSTLLITGILLALFGEMPDFVKQIFQPTYKLHVWFPEARSVGEGTIVRRNGIAIGRVVKVQFATEAKGVEKPQGMSDSEYLTGVVVTAEIEKKAKLFENEVCRTQSDLLGKTSLEFSRPAGVTPSTKPLDVSVTVRGRLGQDPRDAITEATTSFAEIKVIVEERLVPTVEDASKSLADAGRAMEQAAKNVNEILTQETREDIRTLIAQINQSLKAILSIVGDKETQQELKTVMKEMPESFAQMKDTLAKAEQRLDEVAQFTQRLGSPEVIDRLDRGTKHLDEVMGDLAAFSDQLRDPKGSLARLLRDPQLYEHLSQAAENVEELTWRLQPIVEDVRVFTDTIARHPERLGIRGAIQRYPGIK